MIVYNVTTKMEWPIHEAWVEWMKDEHIPEVLATGSFQECRMMRLLETDDSEGPTYAIQYFAHTMEEYQQYIDSHAPFLRKKTIEKWGNRFIAFRSLMQTVN